MKRIIVVLSVVTVALAVLGLAGCARSTEPKAALGRAQAMLSEEAPAPAEESRSADSDALKKDNTPSAPSGSTIAPAVPDGHQDRLPLGPRE